MFRKTLLALFSVAMLLLASGAAPVFAKETPPVTAEPVFTPASSSAEMKAMQEFQSSLYVAVGDGVNGGQIWRSKDGNSWKSVTDLGFGVNLSYRNSWGMTVFKNKLYVAINCYPTRGPDCPGMVLRTANGSDWEQIPLATGTSLLDKLGVFDGMIYATSVWSDGQIWRSRSGNPGTWEVVHDFGLGDGFGSSAPTAYKDRVYFTVSTGSDSILILNSADGLHWNTTALKITDQDPSLGFVGEGTLKVYRGDLYLGVANSLDGGTIYRSKDGKNWKKVVDQTPSRIGYNEMVQYRGDLYVTIFTSNADFSNYGVQLWRSHSGNLGSWELVNVDPADWGAFTGSPRGTMAVLEGNLYIPTDPGSVYRMNIH